MRSSTVVTNSASAAESATDPSGGSLPGDAAALSLKPAARPLRTGPRRASSPVGAPVQASATQGLLVIGADGLVVGPPVAGKQSADADLPATDDAETHLPGQSPPAPLAGLPDTTDGEEAPASAADRDGWDSSDAAEVKSSPVPAADRDGGETSDETPGPASGPDDTARSTAGVADGTTDCAADAETNTKHPGGAVGNAGHPGTLDSEAAPGSAADEVATDAADNAGGTAGGTIEAEAETSTDDADAGPATETNSGPAPLTRRARRLAEDGTPAPAVSGVAMTDELPEPAADATSGQATVTSAPAAKGRTTGWAWVRALLFLALIAAMVLGLGTVIAGQDAAGGPSATEINREQSWVQTAALLAQAQNVRDAEPGTAAKSLLQQSSKDLGLQLAALAGRQTAVSTAPASTAARVTTVGFAEALASSANSLLAQSLTAEGAMGRLFAAAGANRLLQASALDALLGKPSPQSPYLLTVEPVTDTVPACKSTKEPPPGVSADAALAAAARAEQEAVYAYQVSGSRLAEPELSRAVELATDHQDRLDLLNSELARRCLRVVSLVPGFVLDPAFTEAPTAALTKLERQLVLVYGDVASLSAPAKDAAGLSSRTETSATAATPSVARVLSLREIAVAGLVGSVANVQEWGGGVEPLPGVAGVPASAPGTAPTSVPASP